MAKVYFIFTTIPEKVFTSRIKYFIDPQTIHRYHRMDEGKMHGLYAWTTSKKKLLNFLETRNEDIYNVKKEDIPIGKKEYLHELRKEIGNLELNFHEFETDNEDGKLELVTTKDEYIAVTEDLEPNYWQFVIGDLIDIDYKIFNHGIQEALDYLGYTAHYCMNNDEDYENGMCDMANHNNSFGRTVFGFHKPKLRYDQLNLLLCFFEYMFLGDGE